MVSVKQALNESPWNDRPRSRGSKRNITKNGDVSWENALRDGQPRLRGVLRQLLAGPRLLRGDVRDREQLTGEGGQGDRVDGRRAVEGISNNIAGAGDVSHIR